MKSELDQAIAAANAIEPMIARYHAGELAPDEIEILGAVIEPIIGVLLPVWQQLWDAVEPILVARGHWTPDLNSAS